MTEESRSGSGRGSLAAIVAAAALLGIAAGVGGWVWLDRAPAPVAESQGEALIGGPFALTDQNGRPVTEKDFAGRWTVVYFGYTWCPDVCPLGLQAIMAALDQMPAGMREQVVPVFVTLDPERDTVETLREYAPLFGDGLVALTGTPEQIAQAASAYKVYYSKAPAADGNANDYLVDHSAFIYLMGPDGRYVRHFAHDASAEELAQGIEASVGAS